MYKYKKIVDICMYAPSTTCKIGIVVGIYFYLKKKAYWVLAKRKIKSFSNSFYLFFWTHRRKKWFIHFRIPIDILRVYIMLSE